MTSNSQSARICAAILLPWTSQLSESGRASTAASRLIIVFETTSPVYAGDEGARRPRSGGYLG
jgi:hypothetical protein